MAGFFDGEGHIDIAIYKTSATGRLIVDVCQDKLHADVLYLFCHWGGRVFPTKIRNVYRWQAYAWEAKAFLQDIFPYLRVKGEVAKLAIEFQETMHQRGGHRMLLLAELAKRKQLIDGFRRIQPARRKEGNRTLKF